jgi:hypothetical protein
MLVAGSPKISSLAIVLAFYNKELVMNFSFTYTDTTCFISALDMFGFSAISFRSKGTIQYDLIGVP